MDDKRPADDTLSVGQRIKLVRTKMLKLDQHGFGKLIGVSQFAISKWERHENKVAEEYLQILANKTGLTVEWFRYGIAVSDANREIVRLISMISDETILAVLKAVLEAYFDEVKARQINGK